jgi:multidrug efflux pump
VYTTVGEALILVVLVIFLFLRSFRSTLIPFVTIPVSLIGSFIFLYMLGFSINILTLLGIVLAIGLVVDDAIVVLENIYRHIEAGMSPAKASIEGSREIAFAVVAMTVTLAAVFTPLAFMSGNVGKLFTEFALTVASAVIVSGFVALTLTPMMCSKLLRHKAKHSWIYEVTERFFLAMNNGYRRVMGGLVRRSTGFRVGFLALVYVFVVWGGYWLYSHLKTELSPLEDRAWFMTYTIAPEGSTVSYTDGYARQIEKILNEVPEIKTKFVVVAPGLEKPNPVNIAMSFNMLKPWSERERKAQTIADSLFAKLSALPGVLTFPMKPPSLGQNYRNLQVQYVIQAPTYEKLSEYHDAIMAKIRTPEFGLANPDSDLKLNKPQLKVWVDRDKAANVGVEIESIGRTLESMMGGRQVTRFQRDGKQHDVIVQVEDALRAQPNDLTSIFVRNAQGQLIQLSNLVRLEETVSAKELNHFNRQRAAIIQANVAPGHTLGELLEKIDAVATEVMGPGKQTELYGESRELKESGKTILVTILLAVIFIYLVLAAQFESFISPLIIMLTVPLAWAGALLGLYWSNNRFLFELAAWKGTEIPANLVQAAGGTLNVYSQIGLVMLVGLITKHGILIVEFANQLRDRGLDKVEAVIDAATLRLRPILMTTGAMVLGAFPLVWATGAGAETRNPIGVVIAAGLLLGTLLTLFVIPVAYTLLVSRRRRVEEEETPEGGPSRLGAPLQPMPQPATFTAGRGQLEPNLRIIGDQSLDDPRRRF